MEKKNNIIICKSIDGLIKIDVKMKSDTLGLAQAQMVDLFQTTKQNIGLHINNILNEGELYENSTVEAYFTVQTEGTRYIVRSMKHCKLDIILAIGYRVKSKQLFDGLSDVEKEYLKTLKEIENRLKHWIKLTT